MSKLKADVSDDQESLLSSQNELSLDSDSDEEDSFVFVDEAVSDTSPLIAEVAERESTELDTVVRAPLLDVRYQ